MSWTRSTETVATIGKIWLLEFVCNPFLEPLQSRFLNTDCKALCLRARAPSDWIGRD